MNRWSSVLVACAVGCLLVAGTAEASKEKFVRVKPHVNVGTLGQLGGGEGLLLSLRTVDETPGGEDAVRCTFVGWIELSLAEELRADPTAAFDVRVLGLGQPERTPVRVSDGELVQVGTAGAPAGGPLTGTFAVRVVADDRRSRPVGEHCGLDLLVHVYDLTTGETRETQVVRYRPPPDVRAPG